MKYDSLEVRMLCRWGDCCPWLVFIPEDDLGDMAHLVSCAAVHTGGIMEDDVRDRLEGGSMGEDAPARH